MVCHSEGERNFHIFYQLLASRDQKLLSELELSSNPKEYLFLSQVSRERDRSVLLLQEGAEMI